MTAIVYYLATIGTIVSVVMMLPVLIAFGMDEREAGTILFSHVAAWGFFSVAVLLSIYGRYRALTRLGGFLLLLAAWIIFPLVVALAIRHIIGLSYLEAVFEVFSAFTSNGASIIGNPDVVPKSVIAALSILQWLGALATLIAVSVLLAPSGVGGLREEVHHTIGHSMISSPVRLHRYCADIFQVFLVITAICFVFLLLSGVTPFNAFVLTMTAVSTGGIMPGKESVEVSAGTGGMIVMAIFFIISATNIHWHKMVVLGQREFLVKHRESNVFVGLWLVLALAFSSAILAASGGWGVTNQLDNIAEGLFNSASVLSTSGLQSREGIYPLLPPILVLMLLFVGGGCFSTSGGVRLYRIGAMFMQSLHELNRLIFPNIVRRAHIGSHRFDINLMKAVWSFFAAAVIVILVGAGLLTVTGLEFQAAFTASLANFVNAGPAYGPEWSAATATGWPEYFEMTPFAHVVLLLLMLAGRLELIVIFALFNLSYWRNR